VKRIQTSSHLAEEVHAKAKGRLPRALPVRKGDTVRVMRGGFRGPVSLHLEYEIPGQARVKRENSLAAAAQDLAFLKAGLARAYAGGGAAPRG